MIGLTMMDLLPSNWLSFHVALDVAKNIAVASIIDKLNRLYNQPGNSCGWCVARVLGHLPGGHCFLRVFSRWFADLVENNAAMLGVRTT